MGNRTTRANSEHQGLLVNDKHVCYRPSDEQFDPLETPIRAARRLELQTGGEENWKNLLCRKREIFQAPSKTRKSAVKSDVLPEKSKRSNRRDDAGERGLETNCRVAEGRVKHCRLLGNGKEGGNSIRYSIGKIWEKKGAE